MYQTGTLKVLDTSVAVGQPSRRLPLCLTGVRRPRAIQSYIDRATVAAVIK